jgi:hypothetical protein
MTSVAERVRKWRANHPEKAREMSRRWRENNSEKIKETAREWRKNNSEKIKEYKETYKETHSEEIRKQNEKYFNKNKGNDTNKRQPYTTEEINLILNKDFSDIELAKMLKRSMRAIQAARCKYKNG